MLRENLARVEERILRACQKSGRRRDDITLVAVTKVFGAEVFLEGHELGLRHFGENYVQEFEEKLPLVGHLADASFHLIGHLQSNKSRRAAELFTHIQTVDSEKLARRLSETGRVLDVMIEVRLSEEASKSGIQPVDLGPLVEAVRGQPNLRLLGLMTMPPWSDDAEVSRLYFRKLRELGEANRLGSLSMGMSHDFEAAIEEGATHIRVGTALFGKRTKP